MDLTVRYPVGILGRIDKKIFYNQIYRAFTDVASKYDIKEVQIFPANWPRKVLITVKDSKVKDKFLIAGLIIASIEVELKIKITCSSM